MEKPRISISKDSGIPGGFVMAGFMAVASIFITVGIKYYSGSEIIQGLSFYGRYEGIGNAVTEHMSAAVLCSALCLIQLAVIYLMSFSPLLMPTSLVIIGCRGFISGIAYSASGATRGISQLVLYIVLTAVMCLFASYLVSIESVRARECSVYKTAALFIAAGICVTGEFIVSFIK